MIRHLAAPALVVATCCSPAPSRSAPADWAALATAPRETPAQGDGIRRSWTGADGRPVTLAVIAPNVAGKPVIALDPVAGDNGPAIAAALARLRAAGGGTLRLAPGTWPIAGGPPALALDKLSDVLVDGPGARLVFAEWGDGILVSNAARVSLRGLSLGYARPPVVPARVRDSRLAFAGAAPAAGQTIYQVTGAGTGGTRRLFGRPGTALGAGGAVPGGLGAGFAPGQPVQVKLSWYKGAAIRIADPGDRPVSHDITLDHVTVRDSAGGGILAELMGRGLAIVGARIGGAGGSAVAYDGIHVTAATGDILIEDSDLAGTGDDAVNIAAPIYDAALDPGGRGATIAGGAGIHPGARLALFDAALQFLGTAQVAGRAPRDARGRMRTTFAAPAALGSGNATVRYARNLDLLAQRYAIVGNRVADCTCHGVLAQAPDGLIRANQFSGLRYNAIRLLTSAAWKEGAGALNVVVANNRIADTGQDTRAGRMWAAITVFGELAGNGPGGQAPLAPAPLNAQLLIRDNQIAGVDQGCVSVSNAADVTLARNRCTGFARRPGAARMLADRAAPATALATLPAKGAYLARGDGVWIDAGTTARVDAQPGR